MGAQYVLEQVIGLQGMINYVANRTSWMDDIGKQAQWQGIAQVRLRMASVLMCCTAQPLRFARPR